MKKVVIMSLCLLLIGCSFKPDEIKEEDINSTSVVEDNVDIQNKITKSDYIDKELVQTIEKIVIEDWNDEVQQTIIDSQEIETIINTLYGGSEITGTVTSEGYSWCLKMYDNTNSLVLEVFVWKNGSFGFNENKEYFFMNNNYEILKNIINE